MGRLWDKAFPWIAVSITAAVIGYVADPFEWRVKRDAEICASSDSILEMKTELEERGMKYSDFNTKVDSQGNETLFVYTRDGTTYKLEKNSENYCWERVDEN